MRAAIFALFLLTRESVKRKRESVHTVASQPSNPPAALTLYVLRFTFYASRITHHASRSHVFHFTFSAPVDTLVAWQNPHWAAAWAPCSAARRPRQKPRRRSRQRRPRRPSRPPRPWSRATACSTFHWIESAR